METETRARILDSTSGTEEPAHELQQTEFQWLQFNADELQWPDEAAVLESETSMRKFLEQK